MTREIPLTKGAVALVDDADYERVNAFKWHAHGTGRKIYAACDLRHAGKGRIFLHRLIIGAADGQLVDHINGNPLDNMRANLRFCTNAENIRNAGARSGRTFKGVYRVGLRFKAAYWDGHKNRHIGTFDTEIEAARAFDEAARLYHGAFARLNFPDEHVVPPLAKEDGTCADSQIGALVTP